MLRSCVCGPGVGRDADGALVRRSLFLCTAAACGILFRLSSSGDQVTPLLSQSAAATEFGVVFSMFVSAFYATGSGRFASSLCAVLIAARAFTGNVPVPMVGFLSYLLIDSLLRNDRIPLEIASHHAGSAVLTTAGMVIIERLAGPARETALSIAAHLLKMEATTPLLHAGHAFKASGLGSLAAGSLILLLLSWVPIRIFGSWRALMLVDELVLTAPHVLLPLVKVAVGGLFFLQCFWYVKLCALGCSS
jgi:hypothetical protein